MKLTYNADIFSKLYQDYIHFIPYVNMPSLLEKAIASSSHVAANGIGVIIDNRSDNTVESPESILAKLDNLSFCVIKPDVPLTTAQTMNFMKSLANEKRGVKYFTFMHNDGEIVGNGMSLIEKARSEAENSWGVIFTEYDVFCVFNLDVCNKIGEWDWLRFPFYFLDNDYYDRIKLAGYRCVDYNFREKFEVIHHNNASNTIKNDAERAEVHNTLWHYQEKMFRKKYPQENK
jgi:hypothetical protein